MKVEIENKFNEKLVAVVEGREDADTTVVLVHGFGTGKDEDLLLAMSEALKEKFRIVRFDCSGCGESEGKQEDIDLEKHANDLKVILEWTEKSFGKNIFIIAQSMGGFVVSYLSPENIQKTIFTAPPNGDTTFSLNRTANKIIERGTLNKEGISVYPRTKSGIIQKVGPTFWKVLEQFNPIEAIKNFSQKTQLYMIKPMQDEVVGLEYFEDYKNIERLNYIEMNGSHGFSSVNDRSELIKKIKSIFEFNSKKL